MDDRRMLRWAAIGALNTLNALRPARPGPVAVPAFFASWLTSDLPLHAITAQSIRVSVALRDGALRTALVTRPS